MLKSFISKNKDLSIVIGIVLILAILFAPVPSFVLDVAILINFSLALTILFLTFYVKRPVEFSTFPSLLLITTLFRLALNIAATRLILTGGEAGEVIDAIGAFAVGGNFVVGLVVFFILVVVQYIVVTSGAQRVSEVAARFTLDSLPGQQMSIDADLNMGLIDQDEAKHRRALLEKEASFYGAMDGASKFVKGDSIAGIIILLIDIIAGWIIGVAQMGMGWGEALQRFTLLTIGDGIATQLPALIIATATGIIVTRSSSDEDLSSEVFRQISSVARIPLIVCAVLLCLLLLPGMPKWPIAILLPTIGVIAWRMLPGSGRADIEARNADAPEDQSISTMGTAPLTIALGHELAAQWRAGQAVIMDRISSLRNEHESNFGIPFPSLKFEDDRSLGSLDYEIRLFGVRYANARIQPDKVLAIRGNTSKTQLIGPEVRDPAFGLPATWIDHSLSEQAKKDGYTLVDPHTVLITHLGEVLKREAPTLLDRASVQNILEGVRQRQPGLVEELIPNLISVSDVQRTLKNLLDEGVTIANIDQITEHLADLARQEKDPGRLTELLRRRMSYIICNKLRKRHETLAVLSLEPKLENQIISHIRANATADSLALDPKNAQILIAVLIQKAAEMQGQGRVPVLLCSDEIRSHFRMLTKRAIPGLAVIGLAEIPANIELESFDVVKLEGVQAA